MLPKYKYCLLFLLIIATTSAPQANKEQIGAVISDIAALTGDIAALLTLCKSEKDPQKINSLIATVVAMLTNLVKTIIEKRKLKKEAKAKAASTFKLGENADFDALQDEISDIVFVICQKANIPYQN